MCVWLLHDYLIEIYIMIDTCTVSIQWSNKLSIVVTGTENSSNHIGCTIIKLTIILINMINVSQDKKIINYSQNLCRDAIFTWYKLRVFYALLKSGIDNNWRYRLNKEYRFLYEIDASYLWVFWESHGLNRIKTAHVHKKPSFWQKGQNMRSQTKIQYTQLVICL